MAKTKYKVRFRYVWTVYYDLSTNGSVEAENHKTKELAVESLRATLSQWVRTDGRLSNSERKEIRALLSQTTEQGVLDAVDAWNDIQNEGSNGTNADRLWLDRTRLVLSRKKVSS